jgi:tetratricopeptide (TPR) repeat protein
MNKTREIKRMLRRAFSGLVLLASVVAPAFAGDPSAESLMERGRYKQARAMLEKQLAANANDADAMMNLALVKLEFREVEPAIKLAEKAVALKAKDARAHSALADCYGQKAEGDVGMFEGMKLLRAFKRENDAALAIDPKNYNALHSYMEFYLGAPGIAGGSKSKASEMANKITAIDAAKGNLAKGEIALYEKQFDQVLGFYQKALEADPKSYDALTSLAGLYIAEKWRDLSKAESYAQKAISMDFTRALGYGILAQAKFWGEKWSELDQVIIQGEKAAPEDFIYYYRAGRALLNSGKDNARAERYFRKYLSQEPEGNTPTLAVAHWQLGLALEKLGRKQDAIAEVEAALKQDPKLKTAKDDLKRLKS